MESVSPEALLNAMRTCGMKFKQENYEFIEAFTTRIGIGSYEPVRKSSKRYVRATRIDGGRTLFIYFGFTTGFPSEEEIVRFVGGATERGLSSSLPGTWYVKHPRTQVRDSEDLASELLGHSMSGTDIERRETVSDEIAAVEEAINPRRQFGIRLSAADRRAIETRAVEVTLTYLRGKGYATQDVGATESYDVHATRNGQALKVEIKGTTTEGSEVILTANEVDLHRSAHPDNALAVVRRIVLSHVEGHPIASGGELEFRKGWAIESEDLKPIAYRYQTNL